MIGFRKLALSAAPLALLAACGPTPEEQVVRAKDSFAAHRFSDARLDLIAALDERPDDAALLELLARTQLELGDGEAAMAALDRLTALGKLPGDAAILRGEIELLRGHEDAALAAVEGLATAEAWRVRALARLKAGDFAGAGTAFAEGANASGPRARLLAESARFALGRGDLAQARTLAEAAVADNGDELEAQLARAQVAAAGGRLDVALAAYEKASAAWPESRPALIGRIATLGDLGRIAEMEPLLADLANRAPDDLAVIYLKARLAAAKGDWAAARKALQPVEARMDELPQARLLYGQTLGELGQHEQAMGYLRVFVRQNPAHRLARRLLAREQLAAGDAPAAVETIRPLAAQDGASPEELAVMAAAARSAGLADADAWAKRANASSVETLASAMAAGDAALKREDWLAAARAYRRVLEASEDPGVVVLNNLAYAESRLGNRAEALTLAQRALAKAPNNASVLDTAGWLMVETGSDREQGLTLLRKAAKLAPTNATIADHLAAAERG